jgi:hypothetical protein
MPVDPLAHLKPKGDEADEAVATEPGSGSEPPWGAAASSGPPPARRSTRRSESPPARPSGATSSAAAASPTPLQIAWALVAVVPERVDPIAFGGRALTWLVLLLWGAWFVLQPWHSEAVMASFLHRPDLVFHEAGHVLFVPFGRWMTYLGGSATQCLIPALCVLHFLARRSPFSAAVCLWWFGQNFVDLSPYIGDARALDLSLVGEWNEDMVSVRAARHDWRQLLAPLGLLEWDRTLGAAAGVFGRAVMVLACAWSGWLLLRMRGRVQADAFEAGPR